MVDKRVGEPPGWRTSTPRRRSGHGPARRASDRYDDGFAGRLIGVLYAISGAITLLSPLLPKNAEFDAAAVVAVGAVAFVSGLVFLALPWRRWPRRATLVAVPAALVLIPLHNLAAGLDAYRYSLFYLVLYVWIGICHPRGSALLWSPLVTVSYVAPLLMQDAEAWTLASTAYAIPLFVTVGETLAWRSTRLADIERRLQTLAYRDTLTGLANRGAFVEQLTDVIDDAAAAPHSLVFFDLDGFKLINDRHGHAAGDAVLKLVAEALAACCPPPAVVARWAGDEFVALLPGRDEEEAHVVAHESAARIASLTGFFGQAVSASFGVAQVSTADSADEVIARADAAMYTAKAVRRCAGVAR